MASLTASLRGPQRKKLFSRFKPEELLALQQDWKFWARPNQLPPAEFEAGEKVIWLLLSGRGFGKTRTGAEWIRQRVKDGKAKRIALVAPTPADARDVMIRGQSGLLNIGSPQERPVYAPSNRRLTWPGGAEAIIYSGYEPDQLRGPQHDTSWCDELAVYKYGRELWDALMLTMRLGEPRVCVTTTPRPISLIKELVESPLVSLTRGSTYENLENLSPFYSDIIARYEGTSLGEQELHARILDEMPGALWKRETLAKFRVSEPPPLVRIVIAIDPAATSKDESNETGIVAGGLGGDGHGYLLGDLSGRFTPDGWGRRAVNAYHEFKADRIVAEINNGGEMVEFTLRTIDSKVAYKGVHASRGKQTRAEPIAALYEQGKIHHVGVFPELEDQLTCWVPGDESPDRLDANVWLMTELMLGKTSLSPTALNMTFGGQVKSKWAAG